MKKISSSLFVALIFFGASCFGEARAATNFFHFRTPHSLVCRIEENSAAKGIQNPEWLEVFVGHSTNKMELGNRIALQLKPGVDLKNLLAGRPAKLSRTVAPDVFILQAADALTAIREAEALANLPDVLASYPVMRRSVSLHGAYAPRPNDQYFSAQWNLENRSGATGNPTGVDVDARAAWPFTQGEGVTIAVADLGVELNHVDLVQRATGAPHFNFTGQSTNATPFAGNASWAHGTEVSGLAVAELNNGHGMAGVAPKANLASWVIFRTNLLLASDEQLMDMYQYASNIVSVQNHSWGNNGFALDGPSLLEQIGISNALTYGRFGRGVVMVRSAGNDRLLGANANDDGYPSDPRVIAVAAVRYDGRVTSYSEPGACVLVAAPSGDLGTNIFTTDLIGTRGANAINFFPPNEELNDYVFESLGFSGTSAAAPQIAGMAALIISANTNLSYRDVQQILIFSARQLDFADPDLITNGAGFRVSHNAGFGIPDAGVAVQLARQWSNRPPAANIIFSRTNSGSIPDAGLRVLIFGENVPANVISIAAAPSQGPHADSPTPVLPLIDVGLVTNTLSLNLTNKAALIEHGTNQDFTAEIRRVAQAGASFAVLFYYSDSGVPSVMLNTDYAPIPAVLIGQTRGVTLRNYLQTNSTGTARIQLNAANYSFNISETLICEHVGIRISLNHPSRADLRVTLLSPQGTRSVLQRANGDISAAPTDWTYWSTHHFYESSAGMWTVEVGDEFPGGTGSVQSVEIIVEGVAITDSDHDGLDDTWEMANFNTLSYGPKDDPDFDGYSNAREQIMRTNPAAPGVPFRLDLSRLDQKLARLSWPGSESFTYEIRSGTNVAALSVLTNVAGKFPETEWITPYTNSTPRFFQVRGVPLP